MVALDCSQAASVTQEQHFFSSSSDSDEESSDSSSELPHAQTDLDASCSTSALALLNAMLARMVIVAPKTCMGATVFFLSTNTSKNMTKNLFALIKTRKLVAGIKLWTHTPV